MSLPSRACRRISLLFLGWRVISNDSVGTESISGFIGLVMKVVCLGCQPLGCVGGVGGDVRGFFAWLSWFSCCCRLSFFRWEWLGLYLRVPMWVSM